MTRESMKDVTRQIELMKAQQRSMGPIDNLYQPDNQLPRIHIREIVVMPFGHIMFEVKCEGIEQAVVDINEHEYKVVRGVYRSIHTHSEQS